MAKGYDSVVVDGGWLLWRCAFGEAAAPERSTAARFVDTCLLWVRLNDARKVVIAWDSPKPSKRKEIYPGYKSGPRASSKSPEAVREARLRGREFLDRLFGLLGTPCFTVDGWEADDVLASYAVQEEAAGRRCLIATGDKDLLQCVTRRVHVLRVNRGDKRPDLVWVRNFHDIVGFPAEPNPQRAFLTFQALRGDPTDTIPGVKGIGEKGAKAIVRRYPDALERLQRGERFPGIESTRTRNAIEKPTAFEQAALSYRLAYLRTDLDLRFPMPNPDITEAREFLWEHDLGDLADDENGSLESLSIVERG